MNETLKLIVAGAGGGILGAIFFGGLWWTISRRISSGQPALWFLGSLVLRTGITISGFYFVGQGNWQRLVTCLAGFIIARVVVTYLTRLPAENRSTNRLEGSHAS